MNLNSQTQYPALVVKAMQGEDVIGYVVLDSIIDGRSYGGLRMTPHVDDSHLRAAAHTMTLKYSFLGLARGGAKAGVRGDPEAPESQRKEKLRVFGQAIAPLLQKQMYIPYIDMGTDEHDILGMLTASGIRIKPSKQEKPDSGHYTAVSVNACADRAARYLGLKLSRCSVAIEGFGKVGAPLAAMMSEAGARVVAVSTHRGAIYSSGGLDIPRLIHMARDSGSRVVETYGEAERIDKSELLELSVDLLLPCAEPYSLHKGNAEKVSARIICPGANNPIAPEAESLLFKRGVLVVPDFVANCGGALGATMAFASLDHEQVVNFIHRHIGRRLISILVEADQRGIMPKQVAERIALDRLKQRQQKARFYKFADGFFQAGLKLNRRGLIPHRLAKIAALKYFEKAMKCRP